MIQYEIKRFVLTSAPTGSDIAELVWENDLQNFDISIDCKLNDVGQSMSFPLNKYRWEVEFKRRKV